LTRLSSAVYRPIWHRADRARKIHGTGGYGKVAVMGLLERHAGEVPNNGRSQYKG